MKIPVKKKKAPRRKEYKTVFVLLSADGCRTAKACGKRIACWIVGVSDVEGTLDEAAAAAQLACWGITPVEWKQQLKAKHIFTHVEWHMLGYVLRVKGHGLESFAWTTQAMRAERAVPSAFVKFTDAADAYFLKEDE